MRIEWHVCFGARNPWAVEREVILFEVSTKTMRIKRHAYFGTRGPVQAER